MKKCQENFDGALVTRVGAPENEAGVKKCQENGQWKCGWVPIGAGQGGALQPGDPGNPPGGGAGVEYR